VRNHPLVCPGCVCLSYKFAYHMRCHGIQHARIHRRSCRTRVQICGAATSELSSNGIGRVGRTISQQGFGHLQDSLVALIRLPFVVYGACSELIIILELERAAAARAKLCPKVRVVRTNMILSFYSFMLKLLIHNNKEEDGKRVAVV
jgi:hypothetical protein